MKVTKLQKQAGFTLIELIMVIVILGVLSAFALPRFADLGGEARVSSIQAAAGAVRSAANIAHAQWLADGSPTVPATVSLEGTTINIVGSGYPEGVTTAGGIVTAAQLSTADYTIAAAAGVVTVTLGTCNFTYTDTSGAVDTSGITTTGC